MTYAYPARFTRDESGRVLVEFVDFPRAATDGANMDEAMNEAIDCLGSTISITMALKEEIPLPSRPRRGARLVPVPLLLAPKLAHGKLHRIRVYENPDLFADYYGE